QDARTDQGGGGGISQGLDGRHTRSEHCRYGAQRRPRGAASRASPERCHCAPRLAEDSGRKDGFARGIGCELHPALRCRDFLEVWLTFLPLSTWRASATPSPLSCLSFGQPPPA